MWTTTELIYGGQGVLNLRVWIGEWNKLALENNREIDAPHEYKWLGGPV